MAKTEINRWIVQATDKQDQLDLDVEIVKMLYEGNTKSLLAALLVATSLVIVQYDLINLKLLITWILILTVAYITRTYFSICYQKDVDKNLHAHKWLKRFRISTAFCGLAWGLAGILLFPLSDTAHQAFLIFALVGVAGGALVVYTIDITCSNLFTGAMLALVIPRFIINGESFTYAIGILFFIYVVYVTMVGRKLSKNLTDNINLRIAAFHDSEKVKQLANFDVLTGLPNRRLLSDRLDRALLKCQRLLSYGALLYIDLDGFKKLNDTQGHLIGDLLLKQVSERFLTVLRTKDTVARVGGDEFVVVLDDLGGDKQNATNASKLIAEKLSEAINHPFILDNNHYYHSTLSIGICLFYGQEFDVTEILRRADVAMYQAKRSELNNLQFYDSKLQLPYELRMSLETDLRFALEKEQLSLYYQAQVNQDMRLLGAEVLLRWHHPTRGFISPSEFIPIAEESRLIVSIGRWVLMQACLQLKMWETSAVTNNLRLSVNVSALQFNQPDFVAMVTNTIRISKCNPKLLRLELTETLILQHVEDVIIKMTELKSIGVSFSLDDFGTGQSSLSILQCLPLDELKIDRSFVKSIQNDKYSTFIVQTIIAMAKNLNLEVIAEGVEMNEQTDLLQQYGCNVFQGFLFGRPIPVADFEASLTDTN